MVHSFTFPQEMIDSIQERIEFLERCLNDANPQDEAMAEIIELANSRQISLSQLKEEARQMLYLLHKFLKLDKKLKAKEQQDDLSLLLFVRYNFLYKEIMDKYWDFFQNEKGREAVKAITLSLGKSYIKLKKEFDSRDAQKDELYIIVETLKHLIQSVITVVLNINILTEEKVNALNLNTSISQESETTLTFLASMKKWDQVYRNLAKS
ncbi:hypothetical protein Cylst_4036 [Cylindrospermum stagnale PCC 7417]|uniref:Uncharacterized protein n=1 Tax=Cylindrospermum stagnale PCC 7417 TaxID=56107 RepID=K9X276_9NOST|nr:hypothetical protein [Cylindrospermum stagnale]AFZ26146.1 hypothetical protein Cylst_4036 [Cylindrospermum stagnale PCC 7417]